MLTVPPPLLVVCALLQESAGLAEALVDRETRQLAGVSLTRGRLAGHPVAIATCGMGGKAVRRALRALQPELRPRHAVLLGLAGGLDPKLPKLTICRVASVAESCGAPLRNVADSFPWPEEAQIWPAVALLSAEQVLGPSAKQTAAAHGFQLVDMESGDFFAECRALGIGATAVRVVFDEPHEALPEISTDPLGRPKLRSVAGFLARQPWKVGALLALKRRLDAALSRLRAVLVAAVEGLQQADTLPSSGQSVE